MHRSGIRRYNSRDVLRETGIVGIETGMQRPPIALEEIERWEHIKRRVLEIRGVKGEESQDDHLVDNKNSDLQGKKRTRKPSATWEMVIDILVKEKLLPKKITPQALKQSLKKHFPDYAWVTV
jgi:hypothetical protein